MNLSRIIAWRDSLYRKWAAHRPTEAELRSFSLALWPRHTAAEIKAAQIKRNRSNGGKKAAATRKWNKAAKRYAELETVRVFAGSLDITRNTTLP